MFNHFKNIQPIGMQLVSLQGNTQPMGKLYMLSLYSMTSAPQVGAADADGDKPAAVQRGGQPHYGGPAPSPVRGRRQPAAQRRPRPHRGHRLLHHRPEGLRGRCEAGTHPIHRHVRGAAGREKW